MLRGPAHINLSFAVTRLCNSGGRDCKLVVLVVMAKLIRTVLKCLLSVVCMIYVALSVVRFRAAQHITDHDRLRKETVPAAAVAVAAVAPDQIAAAVVATAALIPKAAAESASVVQPAAAQPLEPAAATPPAEAAATEQPTEPIDPRLAQSRAYSTPMEEYPALWPLLDVRSPIQPQP